MELTQYPDNMVFGLDIGTRNVVGTVGYMKDENRFVVVSQSLREHTTRAMLDGQIHDINKVAETIAEIKRELEGNINNKLTDVCIAAAGRVLKTITVKVDYEFSQETTINIEHIRSLELLGVEKAYETIREQTYSSKVNFYCVGYTVVKYYLNDLPLMSLEGHKANMISTELIATFLPDDVIDGLYSAVDRADLNVANLTLEPIAAINIAIPQQFRLLNIALVDVGAGTSDICITKDGSIIGYGMIPCAGDEITEVIMHKYLVEFNTAEKIKLGCQKKKTISYKDIMGLNQKVAVTEVKELVEPVVKQITEQVASKICELNGGKPVSAVFVVGGGGKIPGFTTELAKFLNLPKERVALRGEEVLGQVEFVQKDIKKDPLLVTPVGICMNYYDHKNNFIFVSVNGDRIKLYDNSKLTVVDAALQIGFPNEKLFPQRGDAIEFTVDGKKRLIRGEVGEAAVVYVNGKLASVNEPIVGNDIIEIVESTKGAPAEFEVNHLPEYRDTIFFYFNEQKIECPKYVSVNGQLVSGYYKVQTGDEIEILNYYTLEQIFKFMDIEYYGDIFVNQLPAEYEDKVYEGFKITCDLNQNHPKTTEELVGTEDMHEKVEEPIIVSNQVEENDETTIYVTVNHTAVKLSGKQSYLFVDLLDVYPIDLNEAKTSTLEMKVNGTLAEFTTPIQANDEITMIWKE